MSASDIAAPGQLVLVTVDGKPVRSPRETTAGGLLRAAELDPATRELVRVEGRSQHPYPDPAERIELHEDEVFITVSIGPDPGQLMGVAELAGQLRALGHDVTVVAQGRPGLRRVPVHRPGRCARGPDGPARPAGYGLPGQPARRTACQPCHRPSRRQQPPEPAGR